ncbi:MAG: Lrp/AsnC family transcriptional regulator, partial [Nanoarchaeota archaeon]
SGLIKTFYTEFNLSKLGYNSYYIFIELERITNKIENEIIKKFINEENVGWIINGIGKSNIILLVYAKTFNEFEKLYSKIKNICSDYLRDANFSILTNSYKVSYRFLETDIGGLQTEKFQPIILDNEDNKLMGALSQNAREKITTISNKSGMSIDIVRYRLKKLKENKVINGFRMKLDISKLGIQWHLLFIKLQPIDEKMKKRFLNYILQQKEIYYLTSTIGNYDLIVDLQVTSSTDIRNLIFELRDKFPEVIKNFETILIFNEYKISYLPLIK